MPAPHVKNAYACTNCHSDLLTYERHNVAKVTFASGVTVDSGDNNTNLCMTCHQGGKPDARAREIARHKAELYAAIQQYARAVGDSAIAFSPDAFRYWYTDANGNGKVDPDELKPTNGYKAYTLRLLQAVYNYTFALRDPGAAYHNGRYAGQLLYDSLDSLAASGKAGIDMRGKSRP